MIGHLGPVSPRKQTSHRRKLNFVLAAVRKGKVKSRDAIDRQSGVHHSPSNQAFRRYAVKGTPKPRRIDRKAVVQSRESRAFRQEVLDAVTRIPGGCTRVQLEEAFRVANPSIPGCAYGLTTLDQVGMALSLLHEEGRLSRVGRGVKGDPFHYSLPDRSASP